ncbi:hypothetical protein Bbelb_288110 [Branchiostoma belcheri]|nr:hypothetical protein Bbelb_288110 [Branchiostoma belcheri]
MAEDVPSKAGSKTSRSSNNDANHSVQPRAATGLKQDNETASTTISEHNEDNPCNQPYAVAYQEHDGTEVESANCDVVQPYAVKYQEGEDTVVELTKLNVDDDPSMQPSTDRHQGDEGASPGNVNCDVIQPYAVKYQENDDSCSNDLHTTRGAASKSRHTVPDDEDIQPYAVAYVDQDDVGCNTASADTQMASNRINDVSTNPFVNNDPNVPNQINVPNVHQPQAHRCTRHHRVYLAVKTAAVLGLCIVSGISLWLYFSSSPTQLPAVSNSPRYKRGDVKPKKITFGGMGKEPGKFERTYFVYGFGVAVSADNEIIVTDPDNKRVQVFSTNGTYLRLFPIVVPGESMAMFPYSVALDVEPGYLWVLGKGHYEPWKHHIGYKGHVVQYSKNGQPIKKFDVSLSPYYHVIAMDVRNNKVIMGNSRTITMFDPNGSRFWSSKVRTVYGIGGVISDKEGNILLTDGDRTVLKYNQSGVKIFEFGRYGKAKGQLDSPKGICLDSSGHIIVANTGNNRVDMFTSTGEFVRTIADIKGPWGVALGPCGELVVTSSYTESVTIIPRHIVRP